MASKILDRKKDTTKDNIQSNFGDYSFDKSLENGEFGPTDQLWEERHHSELGAHTALLWKNHKVTDINVKFAGMIYPAHKPVLSCYSTYLRNALLAPNAPKDELQLDLTSVTAEAFGILLRYMYTGRLRLTCQNIGDVYTAARKLGIKKALEKCNAVFSGKADPLMQPIYIYVTAKKLGELETARQSLKIMTKHFEQIVGSKEFLELNCDQVCEFLSCDELAVRSDVVVYLASLKWINHKFLEREQYAWNVIRCTRFSTMTLNEILACHNPPILPGIVQDPDILNMMLKATCYVAAKTVSEDKRFENYSCKPRKLLIPRAPLVLWDTNIFDPDRYSQYQREVSATIIQAHYRGYSTRKKLSMLRASMPTPYSQGEDFVDESRQQLENPVTPKSKKPPFELTPSVAVGVNNDIGEQLDLELPEVSTSLEDAESIQTEFDIRKNATNIKRDAEKVSAFDRKNEKTTVPPIQFSSTDEKAWDDDFIKIESSDQLNAKEQSKPDKLHLIYPDARDRDNLVQSKNSQAATYENPKMAGQIIILGGYRSNNTSNGTKMYNYIPALNIWSEFGKTPFSRHHFCAVYMDEKIYCIGGCDTTLTADKNKMTAESLCFRYDVNSATWSRIADMNVCRMYHGAAAVNGTIYVVGGKDETESPLSSIECYLVKDDRWELLDIVLGTPKYGLGACCHRNQLWFGGGMTLDFKSNLRALRELEYYDPSDNRIRNDAGKLPTAVSFPCMLECDGQLYMIGGVQFREGEESTFDSVPDVFIYENSNKTWVSVPSLPVPSHSVSAVTFGKAIFIMNSATTFQGENLDNVLVYNQGMNQWKEAASLNGNHLGASAISLPERS